MRRRGRGGFAGVLWAGDRVRRKSDGRTDGGSGSDFSSVHHTNAKHHKLGYVVGCVEWFSHTLYLVARK